MAGLDKSTEKWWLDIEFSHLQIRRIVENIVFASTIKESHRYRRLREEEGSRNGGDHGDAERDWNSIAVLKKLVKLSPHALPIPIEWPPKREGDLLHFDRKRISTNHSRLIDIYEKSSAYMHTMNPLKSDYLAKIEERKKKYQNADRDIVKDVNFLRDFLWTHAAIELEWKDKNDPLSHDQSKNAWIVRLGEEADNDVRIIKAEAIG